MTIPAKVRLLDRAGTFVRWISAEEVATLQHQGKIELITRRNKVRAVRWTLPEPDFGDRMFVVRKRGLGNAHKRETPDNPRNVWTIDRVPEWAKPVFNQVVTDCMKQAA